MLQLNQMVGQVIQAVVPALQRGGIHEFKLHGVETGGIWVESQAAMEAMSKTFGSNMSPKTSVFFLPYTQVLFLLASLAVPALSEKGLRV